MPLSNPFTVTAPGVRSGSFVATLVGESPPTPPVSGDPFVIIAGRVYKTDTSSTGELPRRYTGEQTTTANNTLRSTRRLPMREFEFTLAPMLETDYQQLVLDTVPDKIVSFSGTAVVDIPLQVMVEITAAPYVPHRLTYLRRVVVSIKQAS